MKEMSDLLTQSALNAPPTVDTVPYCRVRYAELFTPLSQRFCDAVCGKMARIRTIARLGFLVCPPNVERTVKREALRTLTAKIAQGIVGSIKSIRPRRTQTNYAHQVQGRCFQVGTDRDSPASIAPVFRGVWVVASLVHAKPAFPGVGSRHTVNSKSGYVRTRRCFSVETSARFYNTVFESAASLKNDSTARALASPKHVKARIFPRFSNNCQRSDFPSGQVNGWLWQFYFPFGGALNGFT